MSDEESADSLLSDVETSVTIKAHNKGKKKVRLENLWKRTGEKLKKDRGKEYKKYGGTGETVGKKVFRPVTECCTKSCYSKVAVCEQGKLFTSFWDHGDKNLQDNIIATSLIAQVPKKIVPMEQRKYKRRVTSWKYKVNISGLEYECCRKFFLQIFQISPKRVRVIQDKINNDEQICDRRGKHSNRPNKIDINIWKMVEDHWATIPNRPSHYSLNKTKKLYFENPDLNIKKLFNLFKEYFFVNTGEDLKMEYRTYHKFFRVSSPYAFRRPRTDVCDYCSKCEVLLRVNPNEPVSPRTFYTL